MCSSDLVVSTAATTVAALLLAACGNSASSSPDTSAPASSTSAAASAVTAGAAFPADRCAANKAAGPITYLSSFDFAASASIVDVVVAKAKGYYEAMCLDVTLKSSFSVDNYPQVAANEAQFSSGGSFSEMADFRSEEHTSEPPVTSLSRMPSSA